MLGVVSAMALTGTPENMNPGGKYLIMDMQNGNTTTTYDTDYRYAPT
jgi:hypothetical protein